MPEKALHYIDQTEFVDCDHVDMLIVKGHILLANGRLKEAEDVFKTAISQTDDYNRTLLRIIVSLYDNHYVEAAYQLFISFFRFVGNDYDEGYGYMALCCYDLKRDDEFLSNLKTCCERNPAEAKLALSHLFPDGMAPEDYYEYMIKKLKK